jgi:dTDP-4-dehydrorhamnose reductase
MVIGKKKSKKEKEVYEAKKKTVVIFGVSSFIGSNLAEFLKKDFKVVGTYHKNSVRIPGVLAVPCDVLAKEEVQLVLFAFKPDFVIYCAGVSSVLECHKNEDRADALNTSGLFNVAEYCQRYKAQICYISSGFIFAGQKKNYFEMDIPDSLTSYGKTQAAAEFYIQKTSLNYVIFRCCRLYGRSLVPQRPTWFQNFQRKIAQNQNLSMDDFIHTGFLDVYYLGLILKMCFDKKVSNRLFQVSSNNICSLYEFSKFYAKSFNTSPDIFSKGRWAFPLNQGQSTTPVENKLYFNLDTANLEGFLNINLPSVEESLAFTFERLGGQVAKSRASQASEGIKFI